MPGSPEGAQQRSDMPLRSYEGKSRSVTICCAYMMRRERLTMKDALDRIKAAKPDIRPNAGFLQQLQVILDR